MKRKKYLICIIIIMLGALSLIFLGIHKSETIRIKKANLLLNIGENDIDDNTPEIKCLYDQNIGNKKLSDIENIWKSNTGNSGKKIKSYILEGDENKLKKCMQWYGKKDYVNEGEDTLEIKIPLPLAIETEGYKEIRVNLDYIARAYTGNVINLDSFQLYVIANGEQYGPFNIYDLEVNGVYKDKDKGKDGEDVYGRGYDLVTENIITDETRGKTIEEIIIKPFGNLPSIQETPPIRNWREPAFFDLASVQIYGYKNCQYKKADYKEEIGIDVDKTVEDVIQRLYKFATIKWTPDKDFNAIRWQITGEIARGIKYEAGSEIYGLPYTAANRVNFEKFRSMLSGTLSENQKPIYTVPTDSEGNIVERELCGAGCVSSLFYPLSGSINLRSFGNVTNVIWDRGMTELLGNLEIEGSDSSSEDVVRKLQEKYLGKIKGKTLDDSEKKLKTKAEQILSQRLKSNCSKIRFNEDNYIMYYNYYNENVTNEGKINAYPTNKIVKQNPTESLPANNNLSLFAENLGIDGKEIEIKMVYQRYTSDPELKGEDIKVKINGSDEGFDVTSGIKSMGSVDVMTRGEATIIVKFDKATTINSIEVLPYGEYNEDSVKKGVFRLENLSISVENGEKYDEKYSFGISELTAYFDLDYFLNTSSATDQDSNEFTQSDEFLPENLVNYLNGNESDIDENKLIAKILADQQIYKGYKELLAGDVIATSSKSGGLHVRMITGNTHIEENSDGFIDPVKSYMIKTDIGGTLVKTDKFHMGNYGQDGTNYQEKIKDGKIVDNGGNVVTGGVLKLKPYDGTDISENFINLDDENSNYYINHKVNFASQMYRNYLPIRFNAFKTGKVEKPYVILKNYEMNSSEENQYLRGTISTNYNITSINFQIINKDTNKELLNIIEYPNNSYVTKSKDENNNIIYKENSTLETLWTQKIYSLNYNLPEETKNEIFNKINELEKYEFKIIVKTAGQEIEILDEKSKYGLKRSNTETKATSGFLGSASQSNEEIKAITRDKINSVHIYKAGDSLPSGINTATKWKVGEGWNPTAYEGIGGVYDVYAYYKKIEATGMYNIYIKPYSGWPEAKVVANEDSSYLFANLTNCTEISGLENLDTSNVINMSYMFYNLGYSTMEQIDVSGLNTENVRNMAYMFAYPYINSGEAGNVEGTIKSIKFGTEFNTENVTTMEGMFKELGRYSLEKLDLSGFNTSKVTSMYRMFYGCGFNKMTELNLGNNFNTSKVTNMEAMFQATGRKLMTELKLGDKFNTSNVTNMTDMFLNCGRNSMKKLDLGIAFNNIANENLFVDCGKDDCNIVISNKLYIYKENKKCRLKENDNENKVTLTGNRTFESKHILADTSKENKKTSGFLGSTSQSNEEIKAITRDKINSVNIYKVVDKLPKNINTNNKWKVGEGWNPTAYEGIGGTYDVCAWYGDAGNGMYNIYIKPYSGWPDAKIVANEDSSYLFANLINCKEINGLENLDTSNVVDMNHMFYNCGQNEMKSLDVSGLDTKNVVDMSYMFGYTYSADVTCNIESIKFGERFDTSNVTNMSGMFSQFGREKLEELKISSFNTKNVKDMSQMFLRMWIQ